MTWFDIFKQKKSPAERYSEVKLMLNSFFDVPLYELDNLNIPPNLTQRMWLDSNLETIDEDKFTLLMMLSEKGRYQNLVDTLSHFLSSAAKERIKTRKKRGNKI
tara:strand:- start:216 stop:527 length:312 start_codon:yes stop_codon:yes gene_type:complete